MQCLPHGAFTPLQVSFVEGEADADRDLPMRDLSVLDVSARLDDLEPLHSMKCLAGALQRGPDRVVARSLRRSCQLDVLVDVVRHSTVPFWKEGCIIDFDITKQCPRKAGRDTHQDLRHYADLQNDL